MGLNVKIYDGRVYAQLREVNHTFYDNEPVGFDSKSLTAGNSHCYVSVAPLKTSVALELASEAISKKKEHAELVKKANGAELVGALTWERYDKFKVEFSHEWQTGDYSFRTGTIEIKLKKTGEKWIAYSYHYNESWGVVGP